jgi:Protein of unknown function (DUF2934)
MASNSHAINGGGAPVSVFVTREAEMSGCREPSREEITRRAYELYLQRRGEQGNDVEDWIRAEKELSDEPVGVPVKTKAVQAGRHLDN